MSALNNKQKEMLNILTKGDTETKFALLQETVKDFKDLRIEKMENMNECEKIFRF